MLVPAVVTGSALALVLPSGGAPARGQPVAPLAERPAELRPLLLLTGGGRRLLSRDELAGGPRPAVPVEISIPAARVRAPVDRVSSTPAGIEVPAVGRAGWYEGGPRPGEPGRSVIIGHLDTERGPGVFARLAQLRRGAGIDVRSRRDELHRYQVVSRRQVAKTEFPAEQVYGATDRRVLVLVTCGGPFTPGIGYRDNVIVYARQA